MNDQHIMVPKINSTSLDSYTVEERKAWKGEILQSGRKVNLLRTTEALKRPSTINQARQGFLKRM